MTMYQYVDMANTDNLSTVHKRPIAAEVGTSWQEPQTKPEETDFLLWADKIVAALWHPFFAWQKNLAVLQCFPLSG